MNDGELDLKKVPFAGWLEEALPELCRPDVRCIGFVALLKDGATATNYWRADRNDVALMAYQMQEDAMMHTLKQNPELLRRILGEEGDGSFGSGSADPQDDMAEDEKEEDAGGR